MKVELYKSDRVGKKYKIVLVYDDGRTKTIHIGQAGAEDFTSHKDEARKKRYLERHKKRENWTKSGIDTAGFWAFHLLWRFRTKQEAVKKLEKEFNLKIDLKI